ncbi:SpoIID/LytB domain-containing protein [Marinicella sp. W31]|uniref:SpoIID/LytB domain-containing protein n=1 Tax=Marinicella sp. W31 TaxID=3023713 RepID=UPI003757764C
MIIFIRCLILLLCSHHLLAADVWIRDSWNGQSVTASIELMQIKATALTPDQQRLVRSGHWLDIDGVKQSRDQASVFQAKKIPLSPSDSIQLIQVTHDAFWPMRTWIEPLQHNPLTTIWVESKTARQCPLATVCGFVVDKTDFSAMHDADLYFQDQAVRTDRHGFFSLKVNDEEGAELLATMSGYQSQTILFTPDVAGVHLIVELSPGEGLYTKNIRNPLLNMKKGKVDHAWQMAKLQHMPTLFNGLLRERAGGAEYIQPPLSIRVGFDNNGGYCCGNGCATSEVFSLEYYVQRGLDNEWIASWQSDSLKAGSIPFRSYGAWHVLNGPYNGYDICAGPCCQAFENTGFNGAISAANATRGLMLELNGNLARSEYSAENNSWNDPNDGLNCSNSDVSCGDGFVGSPNTGWSCLYDQSEGRGCFGHGRGMSQWGTQYRALTGENWANIVDHYYNATGNPVGTRSQYVSTPVRLEAVNSSMTEVIPGQTIQLQYEVFNGSDIAGVFGPVMLGASLLNATESYSDPMNDNTYILDLAGLQNLGRDYVVSGKIMPGSYDLAVAIWLDVNNDAEISSIDWVLDVQRYSQAIQVLSNSDLIFFNSFEDI